MEQLRLTWTLNSSDKVCGLLLPPLPCPERQGSNAVQRPQSHLVTINFATILFASHRVPNASVGKKVLTPVPMPIGGNQTSSRTSVQTSGHLPTRALCNATCTEKRVHGHNIFQVLVEDLCVHKAVQQ